MNIEQHIYNILKATVPEMYRYRSPTPGTGSYCVIDMISEQSEHNKDTATEPHTTSRIRCQVKSYSGSTDTARQNAEKCLHTIRTTQNSTSSGYTWITAKDNGIEGGYTPKDERFYYIIDFMVHAKYTLTT